MRKFVFLTTFFWWSVIPAEARFFPDVAFDHPYFEAIAAMEGRGILQGFGDGSFGPEQKISRAAALKVILLGAGVEITGVATESPFPDVPMGEWYAPIAKKGRELGVVKGDGVGNFVPSRQVSRSEALAMLFRTNGDTLETPEEKPFSDVSLDAWYAPHFAIAKKTGLLTGDNAFPNQELTRAELSDLVFRFFKNVWESSTFEGKATFYGDGAEGANTASGERFSNSDFVAAHRTLAFGTRVRVTSEDTQKSVVVRITDRGPYGEGRVIDLSKSAFSPLASLGRGVIPVSLKIVDEKIPLGPPEKCQFEPSEMIPVDFFQNIELLREIPKTVRVGEQIWLEGKVKLENPPSTITVFANEKTFSAPLFSNIFRVPVIFEKSGKLGIFPGNSPSGYSVDIAVISPDCEAEGGDTSSIPSGLGFSVKNGETKFSWKDEENSLFRLDFSQKDKTRTFFVFGKTEFVASPASFSGFEEGLVRLQIWGSRADESLLQTSDWAYGGEKSIVFVNHVSEGSNILTPNFSETFDPGKTVFVSGTTSETLGEKMTIVDPDGEFFEIPLTQKENREYRAEFIPKKRGTYVLEIVDSGGLALFVGGISPVGSAPLIPDFFDESPNIPSESIAPDDRASVMREWLSVVRKISGESGLKPDDALADLAQFRADDMCENSYLSHTDPEGKTASDWRVASNVQTPIGENIVKSTELRSAHEFLVRSPIHLRNILDPAWSRVGLGFCESDDGMLVAVQIFGTEAYDESHLEDWRNDFLEKINAARTPDAIVPKARIEAVAQKWAQKMADENFLGFTREDENLEQWLKDSGITETAKVIVLQVSSLEELLAQIDQSTITFEEISQENFLLEKRFQSLGIGITRSDDWQIFVVLLATE